MLRALLSGYKELEKDGIEWDYQHNGKLHKLLLVPFTLFIKADSQEADKFCGMCGSKTEGVKCVCRVCTCPTVESSNPHLHPPPPKKTPEMIIQLIKDGDNEKLKDMSQHPIWNAMCELRFGMHDNTSVHGAIPWESCYISLS